MNLKISALLLIVTFGCQQKVKNKDVVQLRKQLPFIETPITFNSDLRVKYKTVELEENTLIRKLKERSVFSLLGKVFESESNITILGYAFDTVGTPILITYDNEGNQLSEHVIFETAKYSPGYQTSNVVTILPSRQILFTDSTITRNTKIDEIDESDVRDTFLVTHKKYILSNAGQIELLN